MKKNAVFAWLLAALLTPSTALANEAQSPVLNYDTPSPKWMGSLPLGNGRIGAMVYGGVEKETIALNEVTLWSGQPDPDCNNLCGPEKLAEMRQAFLSGDLERGNQLGWQNLCGHGRSFGTHLPLGDLIITQPTPRTSDLSPRTYRRQLSLADGMATVSYQQGKTRYQREYFTSNPDQTLVIRYTASRKKAITATVSLQLLRYEAERRSSAQLQKSLFGTTGQADLIVDGDARFDKNGEGGVNYRTHVRVLTEGGTIQTTDSSIIVSRADAMTILVDIRTNFQNDRYQTLCDETIDRAAQQPYATLRNRHTTDFRSLFDRMSLVLQPSNPNSHPSPLTSHLSPLTGPAFDALFFQYGRYMQISSSRENSPLPSNLQGIWNDNLACNMPWTCDYHLDINIQQNYWAANIANLAETNTPLFSYMAMLAKYGHETARRMYGCDGWVAHTINNVWGDTAPGNSVSWAMNVTAGAWMMTHLWTHYEYTLDREYLSHTAYPLLKETAKFFIDYMIEDPRTGWLLTGPSISPENGFHTPDGHDYSLSMMPTIDRAVVYDIYNACIQSCRILGIDDDFRARLERDIQKLPPLQLNEQGELSEWLVDGARRSDPSHRHASHLLALYPFGQISPEQTPELAQGCATFLANQTSHPNWEDTEWTRGNNINFYARLGNGDKAYESLQGLYTGFMRENLMTVSPAGVAGAEEDIFSFDATEAAVAGMCEMLLQSAPLSPPEGGTLAHSLDSKTIEAPSGAVGGASGASFSLHFLPALPTAWPSGSVRGICARGAIEADFAWENGKVTTATLRSKIDQTVTVHINGETRQVSLKANKDTKVAPFCI